MQRADRRRDAPAGKVRIIAGRLRNSRLAVPDAPGLRPTPERVRETLFNWLAPVIDGARCLDLCAGTGALGIEALSRGAAVVTFVERAPALARALAANLDRLHAAGGTVVNGDALEFLHAPAHACDIVFLDPPFALELWGPLAHALQSGGWLTPGALVYVEAPRDVGAALPPAWQAARRSVAGSVHHALYRGSATDARESAAKPPTAAPHPLS